MAESGPLWLFLSAFVSSTLLPGGSEALFVALLWDGHHAPALLFGLASLGNTLGGMTSWGIGRIIAWRLPARELVKPAHRRALEWLRRWGRPVLLLSWLPVVGDPLCVVAGWLRMHWLPALLLIGAGKAARYLVVMLAAG